MKSMAILIAVAAFVPGVCLGQRKQFIPATMAVPIRRARTLTPHGMLTESRRNFSVRSIKSGQGCRLCRRRRLFHALS